MLPTANSTVQHATAAHRQCRPLYKGLGSKERQPNGAIHPLADIVLAHWYCDSVNCMWRPHHIRVRRPHSTVVEGCGWMQSSHVSSIGAGSTFTPPAWCFCALHAVPDLEATRCNISWSCSTLPFASKVYTNCFLCTCSANCGLPCPKLKERR
jgi:hypothetical protein